MTQLPEGWVWSTLGNVARWGSGGTPRVSQADYYNGPIPWAVIGDLPDGPFDTTSRSITQKGLQECSAKMVEPGSVLVAMYGSIGKLGMPTVPIATNQAIAFAVPRSGVVLQRYLFWYLRSQRGLLAAAGKGATQKNISQTVLRPWPVPLAPLDEQQRIIEAIERQFSRLDAGVESLRRSKRNLKRMNGAVVRSAFQRDWPEVELGEVAEISGGLTKNKRLESDPSAVAVPYLRVANVQRGYLDLGEVKTIRAPKEKVEKVLLQDGDVLFTEGGDRDKLGRGWVWRGELERCSHQNHIFRARFDLSRFLPEFVSTYANHFGRTWFEEMGKQTTNLASISLSTLRRFPIPAPSLAAQEEALTEIERQVSILDTVEATIDSNLDRASGLKRSMLMAAFSGRLVCDSLGAV